MKDTADSDYVEIWHGKVYHGFTASLSHGRLPICGLWIGCVNITFTKYGRPAAFSVGLRPTPKPAGRLWSCSQPLGSVMRQKDLIAAGRHRCWQAV